jgi:uncharacterized membrane protein
MNSYVSARSKLLWAVPLLIGSVAGAQVHPEKPTYKYEKCHGVVRAGRNDCFTAQNSCAGTTRVDRQRDAWIYVPAGTCEKIVGGSLKPEDK